MVAGSQDLDRDETLWAALEFAAAFRFLRRGHPKRTMFLRAEDVFGYTLWAAKLLTKGDRVPLGDARSAGSDFAITAIERREPK